MMKTSPSLQPSDCACETNPCCRMRNAFVVGGTSSGAGKTSVTLGLCRAFKRMNERVQPFKVGPDYIDPAFLSSAAGTTAFNLDGWMMGLPYCRSSFHGQTRDADIVVVEGVMGLYDGADADGLAGSTAEMALALDLPVVLVVDASSMGRSVAAVVKGFCELEPRVRVCGVVANRVGSDRHADLVRDALSAAKLPPLIGAIRRGAFPELASRHLGLVQASESDDLDTVIDAMADACLESIDFSLLKQLTVYAAAGASLGSSAEDETAVSVMQPMEHRSAMTKKIRIGIAQDDAFRFYYPDNLQTLARAGAELVAFSPLADKALPYGLDALYFGGGYPELFAQRLSENEGLRNQVKAYAGSGGRVYAECGGFMYLAGHMTDTDGNAHEMCGVVPVAVRMCEKRRRLGLAEVRLRQACAWGECQATLRGHEFHYSEIESWLTASPWPAVYDVYYRRDRTPVAEGYWNGNVLAGYVHLHWASRPECVRAFLAWCGGEGKRAACDSMLKGDA